MPVNWRVALAGSLACLAASPVAASNCGGQPCSTRASVQGTSVVPPDDGSEFALRGDLFSSQFADVNLRGNLSQQIDLGFSVNFGFGPVTSLFLNENGAVSFLAPLSALTSSPTVTRAATGGVFNNVANLSDLGVPVIAPFYADLVEGSGAGNGRLDVGDIVVQYGSADPFADANGQYSRNDLRDAVRITWYGLGVNGVGDAVARQNNLPVYAQLLLSSDLNGLDNFKFRYGTLDNPGQSGYGSIAGFSLAGQQLQFSGPYVDGIPDFFEFQDGKYIGQGVSAVPELSTWIMLIIGFGFVGLVMRRAKNPITKTATVASA